MAEYKVLNVEMYVVVEASQRSQEMLWSLEVSLNLLPGPVVSRTRSRYRNTLLKLRECETKLWKMRVIVEQRRTGKRSSWILGE